MDSLQDSAQCWPGNTTFTAFQKAVAVNRRTVFERFFEQNRDRIKVRTRRVAVPKLKTILEATFRICEDRGFHAMSLRDLCEESGLSMGGMYNYIRSKEELSAMITDFVGGYFMEAIEQLLPPKQQTQQRLESGIRANIFMNETFRPWYFFVYMETKNMPREQIRRAKDMERRFLRETQTLIEAGIGSQLYRCRDSYLVSSAILSLVHDWHVKAWQFRGRSYSTEAYADFVVHMSRRMLGADSD